MSIFICNEGSKYISNPNEQNSSWFYQSEIIARPGMNCVFDIVQQKCQYSCHGCHLLAYDMLDTGNLPEWLRHDIKNGSVKLTSRHHNILATSLTLVMLLLFEKHKHIFAFLDDEMVQVVEILPHGYKDSFIPRSQFHGCWWPWGTRHKRPSYGTIFPEYFNFSSKKFKPAIATPNSLTWYNIHWCVHVDWIQIYGQSTFWALSHYEEGISRYGDSHAKDKTATRPSYL